MLKLIVPLPPSVNHCYFTCPKTGRRLLSKKAKQYIETVQTQAKIAANQQGWQPTVKQKVIIDLWWYFPDNIKRDSHNGLKLLLDALEKAIYDNDRYALPRIQDWDIDKADPRVEMEIRALG
jgi:crossover junction endodeoxyribonuclease RusA